MEGFPKFEVIFKTGTVDAQNSRQDCKFLAREAIN